VEKLGKSLIRVVPTLILAVPVTSQVVATLDGASPLHIDKRIPYERAPGAIEWTGDNQIEVIEDGTPRRVIIKLE
jgi:hypothetical protein